MRLRPKGFAAKSTERPFSEYRSIERTSSESKEAFLPIGFLLAPIVRVVVLLGVFEKSCWRLDGMGREKPKQLRQRKIRMVIETDRGREKNGMKRAEEEDEEKCDGLGLNTH